MEQNTKIQLRGNCQCCGRDQAIMPSGFIAKHGYTVKDGWFNGVCTGAQYLPLQKERTATDSIVRSVRADVENLRNVLEGLNSGKIKPKTIKTHKYDHKTRQYETIPFEQGDDYQKGEAVRQAIWNTEQRIRIGTSFANDLEALADRIFGTELREVVHGPGPAPIVPGEKRENERGRVLVAKYVERGNVHWKIEENGKVFVGKIGSRGWRNLKLVE